LSATKRDALVLVLVAVLLGVFAYFAFPLSKTNLGLDLQGGLSVIYQAKPSADAVSMYGSMDAALDKEKTIIQDRVNKLGVSEPEIQRQGSDKISVQLPGIKNTQQALDIIGKTAVLKFFDVAQFGNAFSTAAEALASVGVASEDALPSSDLLVTWPKEENGTADQYYLVTTPAPVTGAMLTGAQRQYGTNDLPEVDMQFNDTGKTAFAEVTKRMAETGQITGADQRLAIVLDGTVKSAPLVHEEIAGGRAQITGKFTVQEADDLALVLQTGALPLELEPISNNSIGATLGKTALNQALLAGAVGLLLIMVFMIAYYRLLGLVACVALVIYSVLFIGILNAIGVTMTLPGIAGMVLTLGMAVDANVLIFARMRDEVAAGKTVGAATSAGFKKAFRAVFDCNMTTIITALILFWSATGGIKGFALTLGIGVVLSFLTAVLVSRSMLNLLSGWRPFRNRKLLGLHVPKEKMLSMDEGGRP
jgi:preprotein translocase subunit SecD